MRLLTAVQMREVDAQACARATEVVLMRNAGARLADAVRAAAPRARRIVAFAGPGNNGGDAFATLARVDPKIERIVYAIPAPKPSEARADAEAQAAQSGVVTLPFPDSDEAARAALDGVDVALDGLLGTGARPDTDAFAAAIRALNAGSATVLAIDIPTGVDATSGTCAALSVHATLTVTLGAVKVGLLLDPATVNVGALWLADIGITRDEIEAAVGERYAALDDAEFVALIPRRPQISDKRSAGAPLIVAGSAQFPGAGVLCALGAARSGAGYVTVATAAAAAATLRAHLIEQVVMTYDESDAGRAIEGLCDLTNHASSAAIGPGIGLSDAMGNVARGFMERVDLPFVADASALFHLAKHLEILHGKRCVLTPHEGEFARLSGQGTVASGTRVPRLREFVARNGVTTLLKGNATLVDDGTTIHVNTTGTPALATAGTGDVLTGVIATLLSQGLSPVDAARAGAYWHGLAGQRAGAERTVGVIAGDIADCLGHAYADARERAARGDRALKRIR
jgi:ADP-dependent NAD(P)H-hydrate dehydratase / NAD(P)H-hydrate epimerase